MQDHGSKISKPTGRGKARSQSWRSGSVNKVLVLHELHPQTPLKKPPGTGHLLIILPLETCQLRLSGPIWRALYQWEILPQTKPREVIPEEPHLRLPSTYIYTYTHASDIHTRTHGHTQKKKMVICSLSLESSVLCFIKLAGAYGTWGDTPPHTCVHAYSHLEDMEWVGGYQSSFCALLVLTNAVSTYTLTPHRTIWVLYALLMLARYYHYCLRQELALNLVCSWGWPRTYKHGAGYFSLL